MGSLNKFWKGVLYGALAGGAVTLLDKQTRNSVLTSYRKTSSNITYMIKHPEEVTEQVKEVTNKIRNTIEEVTEEFNYISGKIEEIREMTPQVMEIVKDTKNAFMKEEGTDQQQELDLQMDEESLYGKRNIH